MQECSESTPAEERICCPSIPPLKNLTVRQTVHLSFHPFPVKLTLPSAAPLCPAVCPALAVLTAPRSHAMAAHCPVMANGAVPAPSQPMDRQLFFLMPVCVLNVVSPPKFILPATRLATALSSSFPVIHFPSPPSCIADHLAGELTVKPTDTKHALRKPANQAQSVPKHLCFSLHVPHDVPAPRLHARL